MEKLANLTAAADNQPAPLAQDICDYVLCLGSLGELKMPSQETHPTSSNWASPLAKLVRIAWGESLMLTSPW